MSSVIFIRRFAPTEYFSILHFKYKILSRDPVTRHQKDGIMIKDVGFLTQGK